MSRALKLVFLVIVLLSCGVEGLLEEKGTVVVGPPPADLEIDNVIAAVGDPNPPGQPLSDMPWSQAARVLKEFKSAGPFPEKPQGGRLIYFGRAFTIEAGGQDSLQYQFLWIEPSGSSPSGLVGYTSGLISDSFKEEMDAIGLFEAIKKGTPLPEGSKTLKYLRAASPDRKPSPLILSTGVSSIITARSPIYIRKKENKVLMVERFPTTAPGRKTPWYGAGRYSELWRVP